MTNPPEIPTLLVDTPDAGLALAIKLSRLPVKATQPDPDVRARLRKIYEEDASALIAVSQVVATNFATIASANNYWKENPPMTPQTAPQWQLTRWFNGKPTTVEDHRGKVIVLGAFQMLCPGCVSHGLPQLQRVRETFSEQDVAVIGLHTVFEHHAAMTPVSLEAFLMEYRYTFPVAVDAHDDPLGASVTMKRYGLRGTPSLVLIDRGGLVRHSSFGRDPDLQLGALLAQLVGETAGDMRTVPKAEHVGMCSVDGECS